MTDRLSGVESSVRTLEQSLRTIEERVAVLESQLALAVQASPHPASPVNAPATRAEDQRATPSVSIPGHDVVTILSFVGRTFVALGGAYLLRALTDSAIVPQATGIALGLAYAAGWLVMADRAGAAGLRLSAVFHGFVASIIAFPLLWEAVTRFKLLGPEMSALAMTIVTTLMLIVAVRQRLQSVAWIAILGALPTTLALVSWTSSVLPFAVVAILLGIETLWIGYGVDWVFLRWPAALVADAMVLALMARVSNRSWPDAPAHTIAVQLLLLTGYLASIVIRTLIRGRDVNAFEIVQAAAALGIGFGGAVYVAQATGFGATALASINLAVGVVCYGVAFAFVARRQGLRFNFYFYTTLALILVLSSTHLLWDRAAASLVWAALGVLTSWLARRVGRIALNLHAAVYVIAAATASALLALATSALAGPVMVRWDAFSATPLLVLAAAVACWLMPMSPAAQGWGRYSRVPRLLITMVLVWSVGGWVVAVLASPLASTPGSPADAGVVATVRTSVLAAAALALAWTGRSDRFRESAWLLYPVLAGGGLKLLIEDLPRSRPATLFVALALYGGALIAAPRLARLRS